jgi:hypothetical protein
VGFSVDDFLAHGFCEGEGNFMRRQQKPPLLPYMQALLGAVRIDWLGAAMRLAWCPFQRAPAPNALNCGISHLGCPCMPLKGR